MTSPSTGQIKLQNTQYCLDAGNDPQLGDYLELQPCGNNPEGNAGQKWDWTSDSQLKTANSERDYIRHRPARKSESGLGTWYLVFETGIDEPVCRPLLGSAVG